MPANVQDLRRRIKATKSIKQITKAMEMIAASKMRRAQGAALSSRPYADLAWEMVGAITTDHGAWSMEHETENVVSHPLLQKTDKEEVALSMVIAPNRGLCGSLPAQVSVKALEELDGVTQRYVAVGRKAKRALLRADANIIAEFDGFDGQPSAADVRPMTQIVKQLFLDGEVDAVYVVYADFISTLEYRVKRVKLLPIAARDPDIGTVHVQDPSANEPSVASPPQADGSLRTNELPIDFLFEPSPAVVLDSLLPRLLELTVYQVIIEALASEHSSRMVTMQNASNAADDLIEEFTLTYNGVRQAAITAEIAEITGGRLAVAL